MNTDKVISEITSWISDYVKEAGASKIVIGLSGGIDSAVSFELAIRAIGKENVIAVTIPMLIDMGEPLVDTSKLWSYAFEKRGVTFHTVHASRHAFEVTELIAKTTDKNKIKPTHYLTYPNTQARIRMAILYGIATENDALVIGTGNRSEHLIGYFTKWGDGSVDFEPLGGLYKSEVYELGRALNVPKFILDAEPSAGLWEGQTDEGELGFTYDQLECVCKTLYDGVVDLECLNEIPEDIIETIKNRYKNNIHKSNTPPIFKINRGLTGDIDI